MESGIDTEIQDNSGRTAYDVAVNAGKFGVASFLKPHISEVTILQIWKILLRSYPRST